MLPTTRCGDRVDQVYIYYLGPDLRFEGLRSSKVLIENSERQGEDDIVTEEPEGVTRQLRKLQSLV